MQHYVFSPVFPSSAFVTGPVHAMDAMVLKAPSLPFPPAHSLLSIRSTACYAPFWPPLLSRVRSLSQQ
jgi:hypothetical protein